MAKKKTSVTIRAARAQLVLRRSGVAKERDALRALAADAAELAESCEEAHESLDAAIAALSKYA
jgi:hypothetical protein